MTPSRNNRKRIFKLVISPDGISLNAPKPTRRWLIIVLIMLFMVLVIVFLVANNGARNWIWDIVLALIQAFAGNLLSQDK